MQKQIRNLHIQEIEKMGKEATLLKSYAASEGKIARVLSDKFKVVLTTHDVRTLIRVYKMLIIPFTVKA